MITGIRKEVAALVVDRRTLRNFGILFFVVMNLAALLTYWKGHGVGPG